MVIKAVAAPERAGKYQSVIEQSIGSDALAIWVGGLHPCPGVRVCGTASSSCPQCLSYLSAVPSPPILQHDAGTVNVQRNENFGKLRAGYLFPEVCASWACRVEHQNGASTMYHAARPLDGRQQWLGCAAEIRHSARGPLSIQLTSICE